MKKFFYIVIIGLIIGYGIIDASDKTYIVSVPKNDLLVGKDDLELCEGVVSFCNGPYNVMCAMNEPLSGAYRVTSQVCTLRGTHHHKAVDLVRTTPDKAVKNVLAGVVESVTNYNVNCVPTAVTLSCSQATGCQYSGGNSVTILVTTPHFENFHVSYLHLSSIAVKIGDVVPVGGLIGEIGNTGCSTGEHLHIAVKDTSNTPVNVTAFFTDKSAYSCGSQFNTTDNGPTIGSLEVDASIVLKNTDGSAYKAKIGNCLGANGSVFFSEGVELKSTGKDANIYTLDDGEVNRVIYSNNDPACGNGIEILSKTGILYKYCHLSEVNIERYLGEMITKNSGTALLGTVKGSDWTMSITGYKNGKLFDITESFLSITGGSCANEKRSNCNEITDQAGNDACKSLFEESSRGYYYNGDY